MMNDLQLLKKRANVKRLFDILGASDSTQRETMDDLAYMLAKIDDEIARRKMAVPA